MIIQEIDSKELSEIINDSEFDFIGYALTPFHLIGMKAYLEHLSECNGTSLYGIILVGYNPHGGYVIDEDQLKFKEYIDTEVCYYKMDGWDFNKEQCAKKFPNTIFLIYPMGTWVKMALHLKKMYGCVRLIAVDDGLASVHNELYNIWSFCESEGRIIIFLKNTIKLLASKFILLINGLKIEYFSIFRKNSFMNPEVLSHYRSVLGSSIETNDVEDTSDSTIIFLGTHFINQDDDRLNAFAEEILIRLADEGYDILIKSHPREKLSFKSVMLQNELPQAKAIEEIISEKGYNIKAIVGWDSTSLVTIPVLYNIPCFTLVDYMISDKRWFFYRKEARLIDGLYMIEQGKSIDEIVNVITHRLQI